jgi:cytoskeletal protein CcmA (bactofilin family)
MAGYIRQSTFADGDTITATLFNNEYNQLLNVFSNTGGHKHDGTAAEGPVIGLIGDAGVATPLNKVLIDSTNDHIEFWIDVSSSSVQQLYIADGAIVPVTDSDVDLGTTGLRFKDAYIDTVTTTGNVAVGGNLTVTGTTTFNGGTITMGDAATDNVVFGADVNSNIIPNTDSAFDLGSSTQEWRDLYLDGTAHIDTLDVDVNATIAGTLGVTGVLTGTSLDISGDIDVDGTTNLDVVDIDGAVDMATTLAVGGEITAASLDISGNVDIDGTLETDALSINSTAVTSTAAELNILDGVTATATEINLIDGVTATTAELNILDGVTSTATELNLLDGVTSTTAELNILDGVTSTAAELNLLDGKAFLDEDNMASNSATGIASQQSIKAYVDSQVTAQDLDLTDGTTSIAIDLDSEALSVLGGTGVTSTASGNGVTLAIDSTVATLTGTQTLTNKTLTSPDVNTPDIDGGTVDGSVIGGATPAAGTFTTLTANTSITGTLATAAQTNITSVGTLSALTVTGEITANGGIALGDSDRASFGASGDLEIFHDGSNSYILDNGTGTLSLKGSAAVYLQAAGTDAYMAAFSKGGPVQLYHNGTVKFGTTATGIDVTGTATMDGLTVDSTTGFSWLPVSTAGVQLGTIGTGTGLIINTPSVNSSFGSGLAIDGSYASDLSSVNIKAFGAKFASYGSELNLFTSDDTSLLKRQSIASNGDISFYNTAGNSQALFWDASAESLGIGTTSPASVLHAKGGSVTTPANSSAFVANATARLVANHANEYGAYIGYANTSNDAIAIQSGKSSGIVGVLSLNPYGGSVGIGTTSPSATLDIASTGNGLQLSRSGYDTYALQHSAGNGMSIYNVTDSRSEMFFDGGGAVGIGTDSPHSFSKLHLEDSANCYFAMKKTGGTSAYLMTDGDTLKVASSSGTTGNKVSVSLTAPDNAMTLDSSGNLLVGQTSNSETGTGIGLVPDGTSHMYSGNTDALMLGRGGSDGEILSFNRSGTTVGSIVSRAGLVSSIVLDPRASGSGLTGTSNAILPTEQTGTPTNNNIDLGNSTLRFKNIYLGGGVYLGGTGAANKLDDYEEGTWTPAWSATTSTVAVQSATYTKIGNLVTVHAFITNISPATSADQQTLTGLPFVATPNSTYGTGNIVYTGDAVTEGIGMLVATGSQYFYFHYLDGTSSNSLTRGNWYSIKPSGLALLFSASYRTDS